MKLGIFGGTFNPIHFGHLRAAEEVRYRLDLDKIIIVPSGNPPLKQHALADAPHRYAMAALAAESNAFFLVSDLEVRQDEKSYTVNTLQRLYKEYPGDELFFILGLDAFLDIPGWWQPDRLVSMIDFIVIPRPGTDPGEIANSPYIEAAPPPLGKGRGKGLPLRLKGGRSAILLDVTPLAISSTEIRALLRERKSIKYLLPEAVERYISAHNLYP